MIASHYVAVAIGGALGAISRVWISVTLPSSPINHFPTATFFVNIIGSFLIGLCAVFFVHYHTPAFWKWAAVGGFLGSFTTFSTFSLETVQLLQQGKFKLALSYMISSIIVGLVMVILGFKCGSLLYRGG